jgi:putative PIN family toxin of toxin-antitoxin system
MTDGSAIIDAHVIVSGLLRSDSDSPTARILNAMIAGEGVFILSLTLLAEYRNVLLRPSLQKRHALTAAEIDQILEDITLNAAMREPALSAAPAPDPGDHHLWALLAAVPTAVLVTGDRLLQEQPPAGCCLLSPRAYWDLRERGALGSRPHPSHT